MPYSYRIHPEALRTLSGDHEKTLWQLNKVYLSPNSSSLLLRTILIFSQASSPIQLRLFYEIFCTVVQTNKKKYLCETG